MKVIQKHHPVQYIQDHLLTVLFFAAIGIISLASCLTLLHSYVTKTAINKPSHRYSRTPWKQTFPRRF